MSVLGGPQESQMEQLQGQGVAASPHPALMLGERSLAPWAPAQGRTWPNTSPVDPFFLVILEVGVLILGVQMGKLSLSVLKLGNAKWGPGSQFLPEPGWGSPGCVPLPSQRPLLESLSGEGAQHD